MGKGVGGSGRGGSGGGAGGDAALQQSIDQARAEFRALRDEEKALDDAIRGLSNRIGNTVANRFSGREIADGRDLARVAPKSRQRRAELQERLQETRRQSDQAQARLSRLIGEQERRNIGRRP